MEQSLWISDSCHILGLYNSVVVQSLNCIQLFTYMDGSMPGSSVLYYLLEYAQIHVHETVMLFNHLILYRPLLFLPSIFPRIRIFSNESGLVIK